MAAEWPDKLLRIKCGACFQILRSWATTYAYNDRGQITAVSNLNGAWPHSSEEDEVRTSENDGENGR